MSKNEGPEGGCAIAVALLLALAVSLWMVTGVKRDVNALQEDVRELQKKAWDGKK